MALLGHAKNVLPAHSLFIIRKIIDDVFHFLKFGLREWVTVVPLAVRYFFFVRKTNNIIHKPTGYPMQNKIEIVWSLI